MNFQTLQKVEDSDFYLGLAFRTAKERAEAMRLLKARSKEAKSKKLEMLKLAAVRKSLHDRLTAILKAFPSVDSLPPLYNELIKISLDYGDLKQSLGALNWAVGQIDRIHGQHATQLKQAVHISQMNAVRKAFYGRVSSIMKQISGPLKYLEHSRRVMKAFPNIKTSLFTVALVGYPNVGKSSLLQALTTAKPEVKDYPFTTKNINLGYMNMPEIRVQLVDVPGTFDRSFEEMNNIEKQSMLVLKHASHALVFVYDGSETCGYALSEQKALHARVTRLFKGTIITVQTKCDLPGKSIKAMQVSVKSKEGLKQLKDEIVGLAHKHEAQSKYKDYKHGDNPVK